MLRNEVVPFYTTLARQFYIGFVFNFPKIYFSIKRTNLNDLSLTGAIVIICHLIYLLNILWYGNCGVVWVFIGILRAAWSRFEVLHHEEANLVTYQIFLYFFTFALHVFHLIVFQLNCVRLFLGFLLLYTVIRGTHWCKYVDYMCQTNIKQQV